MPAGDLEHRVRTRPDVDDDHAVAIVDQHEIGHILAEQRSAVDRPPVIEEREVASDPESVVVERFEEFVEMVE